MENFDYRWFNDERTSWENEWNYIIGWSNRAVANQWSNDKGCEDNEYSYEHLYESYGKNDDMAKHSDEPRDLHKMPSCKTIESSNFERLSNMLDMMEQIWTKLQEISKVLASREEVVHDVPNLDLGDPFFNINYLELDNSSQQEFGTEDPGIN
ncbi:hypothetical protein J1N35_041382 [Gossypium stocksii]|uniref:Uncharacterized protein n=1 Tax=Gossypium stocksii TaxID=47602 RepID=A0A9D3UFV5_9ROSI|nr:hypothetical protein J1N35_041382 [Gossypium stocksii]